MVSVEPVEPHEDVAAHDAVSVDDYQPASNLLRALTAPVRLALIDVLADGPRCVHDLVDTLGIAQPLVSQHLKVLRAARLVGTKSRGREVVYTTHRRSRRPHRQRRPPPRRRGEVDPGRCRQGSGL